MDLRRMRHEYTTNTRVQHFRIRDLQVCFRVVYPPSIHLHKNIAIVCHLIVFLLLFTFCHNYMKHTKRDKKVNAISLALLRTFIFELFRWLYFIFLNIWYCTLLYFIAYAFHSRAHILARQIASKKKKREMATTSLTWAKIPKKRRNKQRTLFATNCAEKICTYREKAKKNWKRQNANRTLKKCQKTSFIRIFNLFLAYTDTGATTSTFHCEMGSASLFYAQPDGNLTLNSNW